MVLMMVDSGGKGDDNGGVGCGDDQEPEQG